MAAVESVLVDAWHRARSAPASSARSVNRLSAYCWPPGTSTRGAAGAATYQAMLHAWIAVHGFVSLEAFGHLEWMLVARS